MLIICWLCWLCKKKFKNFNNINLGDYLDLYITTCILADEFKHFRNKCIELYEIDPANFLSASELVWQGSLKKTGIKLELLADINMWLIVEKGIRGGITIAVHT